MASERTLRLLAGAAGVCALGVAVGAGVTFVVLPVESPLVVALLAVGALCGLLAAAGAAVGYRRVGGPDREGPNPVASTMGVAAMGGMTTVFAAQEVPRLFRAVGLVVGGLTLIGSGLLLVASARADEGT